MKQIFLFNIVISLVLNSIYLSAQEKAYVVFNDNSLNIDPGSKVRIQQEGMLKRLLYKNLLQDSSTDVFTGYFFQNSANPVNLKQFEFTPEKSTSTKKKYTQVKVRNILNSVFGDHPLANETHILSSLKHVATKAKQYKEVHLIILSDMEEWSPIRHMSASYPFSSLQAARAAGVKDAKAIMKRYGFEKDTKSKITIEILFPLKQTDATTQEFLIDYWESVFGSIWNFTLNYRGL